MTNVVSLSSRKRWGSHAVRTKYEFNADGKWATVQSISAIGKFSFRVPGCEVRALENMLAANVGNEPAIIIAFTTAWVDAGWQV